MRTERSETGWGKSFQFMRWLEELFGQLPSGLLGGGQVRRLAQQGAHAIEFCPTTGMKPAQETDPMEV